MLRTVDRMNDTDTGTRPARIVERITFEQFQEVADTLGDGIFLATVQADGRPHVAWVSPGWKGESLWISTFRSSQKGRNLLQASEAAIHWPESPGAITFARAEVHVADRDEAAAIWAEGVLSYDPGMFFSSIDDPEVLFVELRLQHATLNVLDPSKPVRRWKRAA